MSLYPTTVLDATTAASGNNLIPSGTLLVIPIDMTFTQMTQIGLAQLSLTQDYSLRTWVSVYPDGMPIGGIFPILRFASLPFTIYIAGQTPPQNTGYGVLVTPGSYYLNILNLTNEANVLRFSQIDLALSSMIVGGCGAGLAGPVVPTRVPSTFIGSAGVGLAGIAGTSISSTVVVIGGSGTGHGGTLHVEMVGIRLTPGQRLWQAKRWKK